MQLVHRLVEVEMLVDYERGEGRQRHWHQRLRIVRRIEFTQLQQRWQTGIPVEDLAQLLGVERQTLEELVQAGMLAYGRHPDGLDETMRCIELISLNTFVGKLLRYPTIPHDLGETMTLAELVENGYNLVLPLQEILANRLRAVWLSGGLSNMRVSQAGLRLLQP